MCYKIYLDVISSKQFCVGDINEIKTFNFDQLSLIFLVYILH